jgi:hypothetical protein
VSKRAQKANQHGKGSSADRQKWIRIGQWLLASICPGGGMTDA